jgi:hypothetical protein
MSTRSTNETSCPCQHCGGVIEFIKSRRGEMIECPHCNMQTQLRYLREGPTIWARIWQAIWLVVKDVAEVVGEGIASTVRAVGTLVAGCAILFPFVIGTGLAVNGCESESRAASVMHQEYCAIQYCSGFILITLGIVVLYLIRIANRLPKKGT